MTKSKYVKIDGQTMYKIGNKKIGFDTLIFNMQPANKCHCDKMSLCPFGKNGNKKCYALKDENRYKQVKEYRNRQMEYWQNTNINEIISDIKEIISNNPQVKYIRFNESGDMSGINDLLKLIHIADNIPGITIYTYTHNKELWNDWKDLTLPDNLIINGSGFTWTNNYDSCIVFTDKHKIRCPGNCRNCNLCKTKHGQTIYEEVF